MKIVELSNLPEIGISHNPEIKKRVMLRNGELPHLANFSQSRLDPGQVASPHVHKDMYEVFFIEEGKGIIRVNDREYQLKKGVCVAVEPGETHEIKNIGPSELVITYFGLLA